MKFMSLIAAILPGPRDGLLMVIEDASAILQFNPILLLNKLHLIKASVFISFRQWMRSLKMYP